ncbi:hypothetical protein PL674_05825 [Phocaeicola vulgatus]|jgi:hypothetical protein|uniref:Uncharacterized protein n=3 Tax=Bacteroidaceae TaxID=815 RepID=A0A414HG23_BACT4|nr:MULTISPECIES: hypothetical protein [Bacteroidaceae]DAV56417.1 MAG TPA: hypothetical protein [Bacteriophage sp.]AUI45642.1 hypothetical protein BUN20_02870 [Bacteroides fragilis]MCM0331245.1 hypothetical protein [Bacteroides fragilis]MDB0988596.1 hypothetical protein [Phocaeicola vulgatus]MDB0997056.1 hypothetical protein [Phocaeicola vulgatus]
MERYIMDRKYRITYSRKITNKTPSYILGLRAHLKGVFPETERYGKEEFDHVLHCISSFIDDFTFKVRNSRYRGNILKRTIRNDCLEVFSLGDGKVILTVSFTLLET